jgi:hypothetical protein
MRLPQIFTPLQTAKLILISAFGLGVAVGISLTNILTDRNTLSVTQKQKAINKLSRSVNLDAKQREQVEVILREAEQQLSELNQLYQPQFTVIRETTYERIRSELSPTQQRLFEQWIRDMGTRNRQHSSKSQRNR